MVMKKELELQPVTHSLYWKCIVLVKVKSLTTSEYLETNPKIERFHFSRSHPSQTRISRSLPLQLGRQLALGRRQPAVHLDLARARRDAPRHVEPRRALLRALDGVVSVGVAAEEEPRHHRLSDDVDVHVLARQSGVDLLFVERLEVSDGFVCRRDIFLRLNVVIVEGVFLLLVLSDVLFGLDEHGRHLMQVFEVLEVVYVFRDVGRRSEVLNVDNVVGKVTEIFCDVVIVFFHKQFLVDDAIIRIGRVLLLQALVGNSKVVLLAWS